MLGKRTIGTYSTARGGGVAEMLTPLLPLAAGAGALVRWMVIRAEERFFDLTKRIHNRLHGDLGDGGPLGPVEQALYDDVMRDCATELLAHVTSDSIVILHHPQTLGLAPYLRRVGATVVLALAHRRRCPQRHGAQRVEIFEPDLESADAYIFTRPTYAWDGLDPKRVVIIPPSIDVFSPKNQQLTQPQVEGILAATKLVRGRPDDARFVRVDGSIAEVARETDLAGGEPVPAGVPIVTQISRWDRLKDPLGLVKGFAELVAPDTAAHLVVAGPSVGAVQDDPEGASVLAEVRAFVSTFGSEVRSRIHLACLPMDDIEENAAIVNALQRRASVVVQKSLVEGFGLTVAEAMWKEKPIVASRIGGIRDQLVDGESGLLVEPTDLAAYAKAVVLLLANPEFGEKLARAAHVRCRQEYLGPRHLTRYVDLFERLLGGGEDRSSRNAPHAQASPPR